MGLAIAAKAAYRAAKNAEMSYQGKCVVCGEPCKASARLDSYLTCQGCLQPFHTSMCGVYYACGKCLLQAPQDARDEFIAWMRRRTNIANFMAYGVFLPSALILIGMIFVFFWTRAIHWSIVLVVVSFFIALAVMISSGVAMRERAMSFFSTYPVKIAEDKSAIPLEQGDNATSMGSGVDNIQGMSDGAAVINPAIERAKKAALAAIEKNLSQCPWCSSKITDAKATNCPHCAGKLKED